MKYFSNVVCSILKISGKKYYISQDIHTIF